MRKEEIVIMEQLHVTVYCDVCKKEMPKHKRSYRCYGCQRDLCENCVVMGARDIFDLLSGDDYCKSCYEVLDTFRESAQAIHEKYQADIKRGRKIFLLACKYALEPDEEITSPLPPPPAP